VKLDGKVVAQHQGLWQYTIGENARIPGQPRRLIVCSKNVETNEIVVVDDPYVSHAFWDVREVTHCMQKSSAIVSFDHSSGILSLDLEPPSTPRGLVRRWAPSRSED
jgi:tRNA U34 2-thiouridine synthase MnmA/TrmU